MKAGQISMTKARQILAEESNGSKKAEEIKNPDVFASNKFIVISGPGSEAPEYSQGWVLKLKN